MKKRRFRSTLYILFLATLLGVISASVSAATIKLNKSKVSIVAGRTYQLRVVVKGSKKKVRWTSSNKSIATVTAKGKVKAKKPGKVTITVKCGKLKKKCKVTVKASGNPMIAAYSASIKALSWPTALFAVYDINGDGIYEAIVEDIVYNGTSFHPERKGKIFYSYNGRLQCYDYGPSIETFGAINSNRQIFFDRTRGKAIITIRSFSPSEGVKDVTSWFGPYLSSEENEKLLKQYYSGLQYPLFVRATTDNLEKYLSGNGKPTGYSTSWVNKGFSNNS